MSSPSPSLISALDKIPTVSPTNASSPKLAPLILSEIKEPGTGLGIISREMFDASRWSPATPHLDIQYLKFVTLITNRIRAGESSVKEVEDFVRLLTTDGEDAFWAPVPELVPEVDPDEAPEIDDTNKPLTVFRLQIYNELNDRRQASPKGSDGSEQLEMEGERQGEARRLEEGSQTALRRTIFGRDAIIPKGGRQDKLLQSWMEMGYPDRVKR
ncbi:hypothetical protein G7Y79_00019g047530 [Physcia stellaris]|nr:hypothetical protein G7Y79_00019g047530 [Physcia stellaris]